jgi:hypothetical protein
MKQLQIIIGATQHDTRVLLDNQPIGMLQKVRFGVSVSSAPQLELVFPDLRPWSSETAKKVAEQIELLDGIPQVKVILQKVEFPEN